MGYLEFCSNCGKKNQYGKIDGFVRFHCTYCTTIHYENPKPTSTLICINEQKILLVKRAVNPGQGLWGLPGGFIEKGETPEQAGLRELKEETNLEGVILGYLGNSSSHNTLWGDILLLGYYIKIDSKKTLCAGDDAQEARFFKIADMPSLAFDSHSKIFQMYLKSKYAH